MSDQIIQKDALLRPEKRLLAVLQTLGLTRAHVAARDINDWQCLFDAHPDRFASLTLSRFRQRRRQRIEMLEAVTVAGDEASLSM